MRVWVIVMGCALSACQVLSGISPLSVAEEDADGGKDIKIDAVTSGSGGAGGAGGMSAAGAGGEANGGSGGMDMKDAGPPCELEDGAQCNWIDDCGCGPAQHCQLRGGNDDVKATCVKRGKRKAGETCSSADECDNGTCDQHVCRDYCTDHCDGGRCLPATGEGGKASADVRVCWLSCQIDSKNTCASGTTCQPHEVDGSKAAFCLPPADPCPTTEDGKCDEPVLCAAGTDAVDCSCEKSEDTECNPVAQCGCAKGKSCELVGMDPKPACAARTGKLQQDELCSDDPSCAPGLTCTFNPYGSCKKYCATSADCPGAGDDCQQVRSNGKDIPGFKTCRSACSDTKPCPAHNSCIKTESGSFCRAFEPEIPSASCNLTFQLGCDDTKSCDVSFSGANVTAECTAHTGNKPAGSLCADAVECEAGSTCVGSVCRRFCALSFAPETSGCPANSCIAPNLSDSSKAPFGVCFEPCPANLQCGAGLQCIRSALGDHCGKPLTTDCPTSNQTCNEPMPKGTGLCEAGYDTADCMGTP